MADFNWAYAGSGSPWLTGGATINVGKECVNKAITEREYIFRPASGANLPAYLTHLSTLYLNDPSGWNS